MSKGRSISTFSSVGISLTMHALLLAGLWFIKNEVLREQEEFVVESVLNEERIQEEYSQELQIDPEPTENINPVAGGMVSTNVGQAANPTTVATVNIETSEVLQDPTVRVNVGDVTRPGAAEVAMDLGEGEVTGEIGAVVEGYGAALGRLTMELVRMMRQEKILVVWLFDRSHSMKDDQKEIAANFHTVYEELGLVEKQDEEIKKRASDEVLQTVIGAYGDKLSFLTPQPTTDVKEIRKAIEQIQVDESGLENMCAAIAQAIDRFNNRQTAREERRLVIVVVSDESGDDGQLIEEAITRAKRAKSPVYILGRESIFGYPYARIRYKDPKYNLTHWLRIRRGPETGYPECLQWDGLHSRWDAFDSGFGPYEQVRLCKESGGIFFLLPGDEENLAGVGANDKRKFDFLDMRRYTPLLYARREYAAAREQSEFRRTIFSVIAQLNPNKDAVEKGLLPSYDDKLNIRQHHYPLSPAEFQQEAAREVLKAQRAMQLLNIAIGLLEGIQDLRAKEDFDRWRAAYDLISAECVAYRVRLFQYLLAMDDHAHKAPKPTDPKHNHWDVGRTRKMIEPDEAQFQRLKAAFNIKMDRTEYLAYVKAEEDRARGMYEEVIKNHPGTPWATRGQHELNLGFGMHFYSVFRDPNYDRPDIKLPKQ